MKKKLLSLFLAVCLMFGTTLPAYAATDDFAPIPPSDEVQEKMLRVLASVMCEKDLYGLNEVDLSHIEIGAEIPSYQVVGNTLVDSGIHIIPIINHGQVVNCFYVANDLNGEVFVQLSTELTGKINPFITSQELFIIYDDEGAYIYADGSLTLLGLAHKHEDPSESSSSNGAESIKEFAESVEELEQAENKVSFLSTSELARVQCGRVAVEYTLDLETYTGIQPASTDEVVSKHLYTEIIQQPENTSICWSIAVTSIVNYIFHYALTYDIIVSWFNNGVDSGMTGDLVVYNMNRFFDLNYAFVPVKDIDKNYILQELINLYPVYGHFSSPSTTHAVVVRGVNTQYDTFSVMNPSPTTTSYTTGTVSSNNVWTFVSENSGLLYTAGGFGLQLL